MKTEHMDVTINRKPITVPFEIDTWGDLLDWVENEYLKAGQCIIHVYLGAMEAFNYRDPLICDRGLASVGKIAVECGDFDTVVRESLEELDEELQSAVDSTSEIIRLLENRQEDEAYTHLAQLLETVRIFFTVLNEDLGWPDVPDADISREEFSEALEHALVQLISAQENRIWVSVCDVLEYEITPILESWHQVVERTRGQLA